MKPVGMTASHSAAPSRMPPARLLPARKSRDWTPPVTKTNLFATPANNADRHAIRERTRRRRRLNSWQRNAGEVPDRVENHFGRLLYLGGRFGMKSSSFTSGIWYLKISQPAGWRGTKPTLACESTPRG